MFGKIVDNKLVIAGQKIKIENGWITNPTEEQLIAQGYKELIYTEKPSYDDENEALTERYKEEETKIIIEYDIEVLSDEAHNEIIQMKIDEEEAKITARNIRGAIQGDSFALNKIAEIENNIAQLREKLR